MSQDNPDFVVRLLLFAGSALGLISLFDPDEAPFSAFAIIGGALLAASGVVLSSDSGRAIAKLNERYAPWQRVPPHRVMGGLLVAIGVLWTVAGASYAFA